jgi:RNA polymerase sigma-70 factor (ECF subfamily)
LDAGELTKFQATIGRDSLKTNLDSKQYYLNLLLPARNVQAVKDAAAGQYEQLLILRCQAGDEAALGELIARYSPGLRFFLRKMLGRADGADDLLQDLWIDVYRKINRLDRPAAFSAWLYRIARDHAYRLLRRRPAPPSIDQEIAAPVADELETFTPEDAQQVREALDELPLEQREVLVLRFVEQMSYEQIAQVIARPVGTVRSRIHYAKLALRAKLETNFIHKENRHD